MSTMSFYRLMALVGTMVLTIAVDSNADESTRRQPNFIVIQPDDHYFFEEWNPPARLDGNPNPSFPPNSNGLPNINRIKNEGVEMKNAYSASTMCGTSRYSTITGRYPSRSSYGRYQDRNSSVRDVIIPSTKLEDVKGVTDPNDCSHNNISAVLKRNGYNTGMVGKWHLTNDRDNSGYDYDRIRDDVKDCGFDFAEAIYKENMWGGWNADNHATHNMEHLTSEAIKFIQNAEEDQSPFFLYFNPTVPHSSSDVTDALEYSDCRVTVEGTLSNPPDIPFGMTADFNGDCRSYRQSVLDRGGSDDDQMVGAVWVDDAVGSLIQTLESLEILDNTFILFQLDHGEAAKGSLYEGGSRIVQFVRYPDRIVEGSSFQGVVSTIDIAPTIIDIAGIAESNRYDMDGRSWMPEVVTGLDDWDNGNKDRCVFVEQGTDRSIRCGCYKYISIGNGSARAIGTSNFASNLRLDLNTDNYYNLCDETGRYVASPEMERGSTGLSDSLKNELKLKVDCLKDITDPSTDPDYSKECGLPLQGPPSSSPTPGAQISTIPISGSLWNDPPRPLPSTPKTKAPVASPSLRPTSRAIPISGVNIWEDHWVNLTMNTDCYDDSQYLYYKEEDHDCRWVVENNHCTEFNVEEEEDDDGTVFNVGEIYCPQSCGHCQ
jgi:arylsulfatase A-like enzyme